MTITIDYFSDVLCVWAYVSQIRIDELQREFAERIALRSHYFPVFGHVHKKIESQWHGKGGLEGYAQHVQATAKPFDHVALHPALWIENTPTSSLPAHLWLAALRCLEQDGACEGGAVERAAWAMRQAFFREAQDIAHTETLRAIVGDHAAAAQLRIDRGEAHAIMSQDLRLAMDLSIRSSPTLVFNEDRQRLTGNVGYKIIQANVRELLESPNKLHSWC